jgi:hypothetical protein
MWSFTRARPGSANIITPHELTEELAESIAVMHALDGDNVPNNELAAAKAALGAWNTIEYSTRSTNRTKTLGSTHGTGIAYQMPDSAGNPWFLSIETGDGYLEAIVSTWVEEISGPPNLIRPWFGLRVDGRLVARQPIRVACLQAVCEVDAAVAVGAGTHIVEAVWGLDDPSTGTGWNRNVQFDAGVLWARGAHR